MTTSMTSTGYRRHLQHAVGASAAPHGYTLTLWTCGSVTTHAQGSVPSTLDAVLLLCGAVSAFALVGAGAFGSINRLIAPPGNPDVRVWAGIHLPSVGISVLLCSIIVHVLPGQWRWPLVGFTATATYMLVLAAQFWMTTWKRTPPAGSSPAA